MKKQHPDIVLKIISDTEMHEIFGDDSKKLTAQWLREFDEKKKKKE